MKSGRIWFWVGVALLAFALISSVADPEGGWLGGAFVGIVMMGVGVAKVTGGRRLNEPIGEFVKRLTNDLQGQRR